MNFEVVSTNQAPAAVGAYSQAIKTDDLVFASGQIALEPETGEFVSNEVQAQTEQCMKNLKAVLAEAGCSMSDIAKTTIYLTDMDNFGKVNDIYAEFFTDKPPARGCVEVSELPKGALVEIEAIAVVK